MGAIVVVLIAVVKSIGFYFPIIDHIGSVIDAEQARIFLSVGLAAIGFICDKSRKAGAICALAALIFPFIAFALEGEPNTGMALWIAGYACTGLPVVYCTLVFADLAAEKPGSPFAGLGLLLWLTGSAVGAGVGVLMKLRQPALIWISAALLTVAAVMSFICFSKVYSALSAGKSPDALLHSFEERYALSAREATVFSLILNSRSNSEIAADLYVTESTVKFHVKNILRKTGCANRAELISAFRKSNA